ncbi:Tex family protein [Alkalilimnicola sp. S0819]|uniref:Tex family protein n=1 Tax=Alkalilimnicola sp. S0819 TaxID=2613922 RepID=UPI0012614B08|nr:Tex family protein [Alkalilimnicola sp. S0819]KAB7627288.1 RNA-binding transcriptional accessory protein [Alkalilimnicola sp. S0819]MPQ16001.1 S1 RNA-binding domain-containing protein [Alkalilimnicola sp. S0819]
MSSQTTRTIAEELQVRPEQVEAAVRLLDEGATVPFIARYRKEATGGLDDTQLRALETRLAYLRELEERREAILRQIEEQGQLTPALAAELRAAETKQRLEDLYLPYKKKRRTKGQQAIEAGLAPLADALLDDPTQDPRALAGAYLNPEQEIPDADAALAGARYILAERFAEDPELSGELREYLWEHGLLRSAVISGMEDEGAKFSDYFDAAEAIQRIPSHRALALFRGRKEKVLRLALELPEERAGAGESLVAVRCGVKDEGRAADPWLAEVVRFTWRVKLLTRLETELFARLREGAEAEAISVFARNLHDLLLAAPAGAHTVMGIDPGIRTGCKVAVVDATGKLLDTATIYPLQPHRQWDQSIAALAALAARHRVGLVAIGNGTGSRETDRLVGELCRLHPALRLQTIMVSEAGASVYSASELAAREFPDLDVSLRGAVSIARRLQDPLAELVKIEAKAIGVGQYQHDVSQSQLARSLEAVVEDCVNAVGVDVNTASAPLLSRVSGLNATLAERIVAHRDQHGPFRSREQLKRVERFGAKTFEQAAGFLRIRDGEQPLDASAVHPEAYPVVERILADIQRNIAQLIGDRAALQKVPAERYTDERFGLPTVRDILRELEKPGRDPRPDFKTASFREGVEKPSDLEEGMILEGVVTNVTNFGAFVDVGVHQDGLVHVSALADRFVKDPREVVKPGDVVKVRVQEVDLKRNRISLSMRLQAPAEGGERPARREAGNGRGKRQNAPRQNGAPRGAMAEAFAKLKS